MATPKARLRWCRLTPDWLLFAELPLLGVLWLFHHFRWLGGAGGQAA